MSRRVLRGLARSALLVLQAQAHWTVATFMTLHRLSWRIGLPFVLLVLAETVTLVVYMTMQIAAEERARLEHLAETDVDFITQASLLPGTERLAANMQRVSGCEVFFRRGEVITPAPDPELRSVLLAAPADGRAHRCGSLDVVAAPLDGGQELLLARPVGPGLLDPRILQVLVPFWLVALVIAWLAVRGLVRPLRQLALHLPGIDSPGPLHLAEATRKDEVGDVARAFLSTRDALHREREHRAAAEKMAVLGRMTAALAHEISNPVAAIKMHAQLWRGSGADDTAAVIEHEAVRIENLLNQWMFLSRPEPPAMRSVDLVPLLAQVVRAHRAQLDHTKVAAVVTARAPLEVSGDGKRLGQVFSNLLMNAIQAMPSGGEVTIDARAAGTAVEVVFADRGKGFSPAALAHFAETNELGSNATCPD